MQQMAEKLAGVLEEQIENYHVLKRLALEKRKALAANDLKQVSGLTTEIQLLAAANYRLEEERKKLAERLAVDLGLRGQNHGLCRIADHLGGPISARLHALRAQATAAIQDVQRQNRINAEMLRYCSNLVDSVLRNLVEPESDQAVYSSNGERHRERAPARLLDQRI